MGKKYIIELANTPYRDSKGNFKWDAVYFNTLTFDEYGLEKLTPYTEPDLEQIRKEGYQKGYETGYEDGYNEPGKNQQEAYQRGLADAWEAARKIGSKSMYSLEEMGFDFSQCLTDYNPSWFVVKNYSVSEVIEEIRAYEQAQKEKKEQEEQIQVGDEVITASGKAVVTGVGPVHFEYDYADGSHGDDKVKSVEKTGRNFPEIAAVLEKMRGEQDG